MPRIRTIKPEFWTSAQVLECSTNARLLFIGLWNFADDHGRHPDNTKQVKAEVFPADDFTLDDIRGMLDELSANGLITRYVVDGEAYFFISGWHHQRIDKPQPPKYPAPVQDHSTNDRRSLPPDRKGREGKGKEGKGKKPLSTASTDRGREVAEVFDHWRQTHGHPKAQLDPKRRRLIRQALDRYSAADLCRAISGYCNSPHHMGQNDRGTRYDDIGLFLRDAAHIDAGLRFAEQPPRTDLSNLTRRNVAAISDWQPPELRRAAD